MAALELYSAIRLFLNQNIYLHLYYYTVLPKGHDFSNIEGYEDYKVIQTAGL